MTFALLKKLAGLAGVLVVVWTVYLYRQVPRRQAPFAGAAKNAEYVLLKQGPNKVELRKNAAHWTAGLGGGPFYAADDGQVASLVTALKDVQIEDEISSRADRANDFEVTLESGAFVHISGPKNEKPAEGLFGKQAPDFNHIYFRFPDKPNVYLARGIIRGELGGATVNAWRSRQLMTLPEAKIKTIVMAGKGYKTDLVRTSTDVWTLKGKIIDPAQVNALVGTLAHLRADDFVDPSADPTLTFEGLTYARVVIISEGASVDLHIGAQDLKTKRYPVSTGKESGLAWMSQSTVESLLKKPSAFPTAKTLAGPPIKSRGKGT